MFQVERMASTFCRGLEARKWGGFLNSEICRLSFLQGCLPYPVPPPRGDKRVM